MKKNIVRLLSFVMQFNAFEMQCTKTLQAAASGVFSWLGHRGSEHFFPVGSGIYD